MVRLLLMMVALISATNCLAKTCEAKAKLGNIEVRECDGPNGKGLVTLGWEGTSDGQVPYDEIVTGLEVFWAVPCSCYLLQVTGIGGAHTRIARYFRAEGPFVELPGGVFGSEIGSIGRIADGRSLVVEVRDFYQGKRSLERYSFDGKKFRKLK